MVHSEVLFLKLIHLYQIFTDETKVDIESLEQAFNSLVYLCSNHTDIPVELDFLEELKKLEENYDDLFLIDDDFVGFKDYDALTMHIMIFEQIQDEATELDQEIDSIIQNFIIYQDLHIPIPFNEYEYLFQINSNIIFYHLVLANKESNNTCQLKDAKLLKFFTELLDYHLLLLDEEDYIKVNSILTYYNQKYLSDNMFHNANWHVAMFGNNVAPLYYDRVFRSLNEEIVLEDYQDEENELDNLIEFDDTEYLDEQNYFISIYTFRLAEFLPAVTDKRVRELLNVRKHLLMTINSDMENDYAETGTIDISKMPKTDESLFTNDSFSSFYSIVLERIQDLNCLDRNITSEKYASMIMSAIFIRTFLDLSIDKEKEQEIARQITSRDFYKQTSYSTASFLIDNIIFYQNGLGLQRRNNS
ncbi:MAG TPA: hypothetical protein IAB49_03550 [Candidatus Caccenecus avistercoris]|nr:hypothetical protein [Candidatus Caccenecus avistercoris]